MKILWFLQPEKTKTNTEQELQKLLLEASRFREEAAQLKRKLALRGRK